MTITNILGLPAAVSLTGAESFPLVQAGTDKKATVSQILGFSSGTTAVAANLVYAGPALGAALPPTFRSLVTADLPSVIAGGAGAGSTLTLESTSGAGTTDFIAFLTGSQVERARIDTSGNILIGTSSNIPIGGLSSKAQFAYSNSSLFTESAALFSADANSPSYGFAKSRNATIGSHTVVQSGDSLGTIAFYGSDGTAFQQAAYVVCKVDGSIAVGSVPGRLAFLTTPVGGTSSVEAMRIDNAQNVIIASGGTTAITALSATPSVQQHGVNLNTSAIANFRWSNDGSGSSTYIFKSRGATIGTHGAVISGDSVGSFSWAGDDGTNFQRAAFMICVVDNTVSAGVVPGRLQFHTANASGVLTEALRIDSTGTAVLAYAAGGSAPIAANSNGDIPSIQVLNNAGKAGILLARYTAAATGPDIYLSKSRSATTGTQTVVQVNDAIGNVSGNGSDGTNFIQSSRIAFLVDASPSTNIVPGRIAFFTQNSSGAQLEAMRIDSNQHILIGNTATPIAAFQQSGNIGGNTCAIFGYGGTAPISLIQNEATIGFNGYYNAAWLSLSTGFGAGLGFNQSNGYLHLQSATASVTGQGATFTFVDRIFFESTGRITQAPTTAIPAGGTNHLGYCFSTTADFGIFFGSGAPTLSAAQGSIYLRSDGNSTTTRMYVNTNGSTTWTAVNTVA